MNNEANSAEQQAAETLNLDQLEALALAATPGPWHWGGTPVETTQAALDICRANIDATKQPGQYFCEVFLDDGRRTALVGNGPTSLHNAAWIAAANPATILKLIAMARPATSHEGKVEAAPIAAGNYSDADRTTLAFMGIGTSDAAATERSETPADEVRNAALEEAREACIELMDGAHRGAYTEACKTCANAIQLLKYQPATDATRPAPTVSSSELKTLLLEYWMNDMDHAEFFNRAGELLGVTSNEYVAHPSKAVSSSAAPSDERVSPHDVCRETERLYKARINELEAARIAYASEFPADAEGDPDVGNIQANIRGFKKQLATPSVQAVAAPVAGQDVPEGWKLVPIEPTENMIVDGFESAPAEGFSQIEAWEAYQAMSGCQQAAHRARLCYAAMLAAAPAASPVELTDAPHSAVTPMFLLNAAFCIESPHEVPTSRKREVLASLHRVADEMQAARMATNQSGDTAAQGGK